VLSALYLFAYLSLGIVALVLGVVATQRGLGLAVDLGAGVITLLSLATISLLATLRNAVPRNDGDVDYPFFDNATSPQPPLHGDGVPTAPILGADRGKSASA
jgi:hypothetical protein